MDFLEDNQDLAVNPSVIDTIPINNFSESSYGDFGDAIGIYLLLDSSLSNEFALIELADATNFSSGLYLPETDLGLPPNYFLTDSFGLETGFGQGNLYIVGTEFGDSPEGGGLYDLLTGDPITPELVFNPPEEPPPFESPTPFPRPGIPPFEGLEEIDLSIPQRNPNNPGGNTNSPSLSDWDEIKNTFNILISPISNFGEDMIGQFNDFLRDHLFNSNNQPIETTPELSNNSNPATSLPNRTQFAIDNHLAMPRRSRSRIVRL